MIGSKINPSDIILLKGAGTEQVFSDFLGYIKNLEVKDDNRSVGVIDTSCETDNKYYSYYIQNCSNAECYFLPIDWLL